jgi:murein DD-endopeptidase MepM/ murein hydrolase activator NlpD
MHLEYTHPAVQAEIAEIFAEVNELQLVEDTEIRYDADGDPYEWKILNVILHPKPFEEVVTPRLESANAKDLYEVFMGSGGNQQAFGNPFTFNWSEAITSYYGNRPNPTGEGYDFHTGLDIAAADGTPIRSLQDGVVVASGWHDLYGNYMVIRNEENITTLYAHCSALYGNVNDVVRQGQLIAAVGSTGNTTGAHLHVEIKLGDERVDPLFYIQSYNET